MRASILKRLLFARIRGSIVFALGVLTATGCMQQANLGESYNYNTMAYSLLSAVIGSVTGTPYDDFVEHKLPPPLVLNHARSKASLLILENSRRGTSLLTRVVEAAEHNPGDSAGSAEGTSFMIAF